MLPDDAIKQLKSFTDFVVKNPHVLHTPQLLFFRRFIESFGGKIPAYEEKTAPEPKVEPEKANDDINDVKIEVDDEVESEVELDNSGVVENPDEVTDESPCLDVEREVSEEDMEKANEKKAEAISAFNEGDYETAVKLYTEAIGFNPVLSLLYAKRGQCNLKLNKPNACIRDCNAALLLNPDNAAAYKFRGRAYRLLGKWLEAAQDLRSACKIDLDEQADEWLKEVTPNARKLEEHKLKYERIRREKEIKEKQERIRKVREEHAKAASAAPSGGAGAAEGADGAGFDFSQYAKYADLLSDPELAQLLEDPEVAAAFQDFSTNPGNIGKYSSNPKIMKVVNKLATKFFQRGGAENLFSGLGGKFPFGGGPPGGAPTGGAGVPGS